MGRIFQTRIRDLKFTLSPFTSEQMSDLGTGILNQKLDRISRGLNSQDQHSKELVKRYEDRKLKRNRQPFRDWRWSGQMLGSFKVKVADQDHVTIGFVNPLADQKATKQRRAEEMLSDSPRDREVFEALTERLILGGGPRVIVRRGAEKAA